MLNKFLIIILAIISSVFATTQGGMKYRYNGMCCDWYYDGYYDDGEPYDNIILHSGSALSMFGIMNYSRQECIAESLHPTYDKYLTSNPKLEGTVVIKFTIDHIGYIVYDTILSSTTKNKKFDEDVRTSIHKCKWQKTDSGTTTITFPFTFWKSKDDYYKSKKVKKGGQPLNIGDESYTTYWRAEREKRRAEKEILLLNSNITLEPSGVNNRDELSVRIVFLDNIINLREIFHRYLKLKKKLVVTLRSNFPLLLVGI